MVDVALNAFYFLLFLAKVSPEDPMSELLRLTYEYRNVVLLMHAPRLLGVSDANSTTILIISCSALYILLKLLHVTGSGQ